MNGMRAPPPSTASQLLNGYRYDKGKILIVPATPLGSCMYKARTNTMTVMTWEIRGAQERMRSTV